MNPKEPIYSYNPYDFVNPVTDRHLFVGRSRELRDIEYYLDHAAVAPSAINLALIGERASGKTSFLNMIQKAAEERGFLIVRVDLNEGDASASIRLFYKIFEGLLFSACDSDAFGGLRGNTYNTYRDVVDTYEIPDDKKFCPFLFPLQYAKAMSRAKGDSIGETFFKRDLATISEAVGKPCIILFDECDVLTTNRVALQQLRNAFMNLPGYMLVFAGTTRLFPRLHEAFSPIARQFKRIDVGNFARLSDTQACMQSPLDEIGAPAAHLLAERDHSPFRDVHQLSAGKAYLIQLLCHFMFKRVQLGQASSMRITIDVLDDVRRELKAAHASSCMLQEPLNDVPHWRGGVGPSRPAASQLPRWRPGFARWRRGQ